MPKIVIIASKVTPYRVPVFQKMSRMRDIDLHVLFCSEREPNRLWELPALDFSHAFLRERYYSIAGRYIHVNPDVISHLKKFSPDVVVTTGFQPTQLCAFGYARLKGWSHVPMTDGTADSERGLSAAHRFIRRFVYARSNAFVSASGGGERLYANYGISPEHRFRSCLCIDNEAFTPPAQAEEKRFDFLFSGRIEEVKNPLFALDIAKETAKRLGRKTSILFVGSGSEEASVREAAAQASDLVTTSFNGFAAQHELPALYRSCRMFLFPTRWDPWGVVLNEACAAGLPILCSPHSGAAGELIRHQENGFISDLDIEQWTAHATALLADPVLMQRFAHRSLALAAEYTYDQAAEGLAEACRHSTSPYSVDTERGLA